MAESTDGLVVDGVGAPGPRWITASLNQEERRDPLGLMSTTQDRLMPMLLPGILQLSLRARYFSFHAFLLDEYRRRRLPADRASLGTFIRRREWELGLAVQRCPKGCGSSPIGARRLGGLARKFGPFPRGESVQNPLGGYHQYYRSPLIAVGIVAEEGTTLGGTPIPIDVLHDIGQARRLADGFRAAVADTAYYRRLMLTNDELPAEVIDEYAEVACLCRLRERPQERDAVYEALFGLGFDEERTVQRRRSVGHFLTLVAGRPDVVADSSDSAFRDALWEASRFPNERHARVAGQWAAVVAKDVWQEAICSVWSEFCRAGLARTRGLGRGLTWEEARRVASGLVTGPPVLDGGSPTDALADDLTANAEIADASIEDLRRFTVKEDTAASGLLVLLELARRAAGRSGSGWQAASHAGSAWQPSVAAVLAGLREHLAGKPTVGQTLWWLVSRFILPVHERIAYSKLPAFTFRFRWDDGRLRFYDLGVGRFRLAGIRYEPLAQLTRDLGLWDLDPGEDGQARLTARGAAFVQETLA